METSSPPLTPIRNYMSPIDTSPTSSYREQLRRRTSSFSSNHSISPVTPRSKHRFSNGSQYSTDLPTPGEEGGGLGNLADELDQLDDEEEYEEDTTENTIEEEEREGESKEPRDSGIDVTYHRSRTTSPSIKNFSKPFGSIAGKPPDGPEEKEDGEDRLSPDLEDAMNSIARMTSYSSTTEDPLIPRTMGLLQDLGNQATLEAHTQRLTTSTNSLAAHLTAQSKSLQILATSLYSPFAGYSTPLDPEIIDETFPLVESLLKDLPLPDTSPLQGLQKLERETLNLTQTLSGLTDTIQMGKQITNSAARHLRTTQTMVADLRRERERADLARHELAKANVADRLKEGRYAKECQDILAGFEDFCDALRESIE